MGIEALSRGAENVYFFDRDPKAWPSSGESRKRTGFSDLSGEPGCARRRGLDGSRQTSPVRRDLYGSAVRDVVDSLSLFDEIERAQLLAADGVIVLET